MTIITELCRIEYLDKESTAIAIIIQANIMQAK